MIGIHKPICYFWIFAFASILFAANATDPFVGTWKLNPTKAKYSAGAPHLKDATIMIEEQGDNYHVTVNGTNADGSPLSIKYTVPANGGTGQVQESGGGMFDALSSKRINSNERETTYMKGGKDAGTRRSVVSKNGKRMTNTFKGTNAEGSPVTSVQVFDKQR